MNVSQSLQKLVTGYVPSGGQSGITASFLEVWILGKSDWQPLVIWVNLE